MQKPFPLSDADHSFLSSSETSTAQNALTRIFLSLRQASAVPLFDLISLPELHQTSGKWINALRVATRLADKPVNLGYHNQHHSREVTLMTQKMIAVHQQLAASGKGEALTPDQIAATLVAAAIHDHAHNGKGNRVNGEYVPVHLERHAVETAWPELSASGLTPSDRQDLEAIIDPTDIFPSAAAESPRHHLMAVFGKAAADAAISPRYANSLGRWRERPWLATAASILSDADLGISAGLSVDMTRTNASGFVKEIGDASVANVAPQLFFLEKLCAGFPISAAGNVLMKSAYDAMIASLKHRAERTPNAPI